MSVAVWSGSLVAWERELVALKERIGPVFGRAETRATAGAFLDGLLSGVTRKTGWLLAEQAGLERPYRMQSLLRRSHGDADALRDRVRADVIEGLGDRDGVLVVDETGFLKKGEHSVGVARQYSGTAGRIENCQVGVFLAYASRYGQALIDRRLYLPDVWAQDESKRTKAGVPEEITFVTKPQMACALIAAALDAGAPCAWCWRTPCMGRTRGCAACWRHGSSPTCWRCAPTTACASGPRRGWRRPTPRRWPMPWRGMPGPRTRPARARRGCGCMSGRGSRCLRPLPRASSTGF